MKNTLIKSELTKRNMKQWELAEIMNMNEFSLSRKLRHDLPEEEQRQIVSLIKEHEKKKGV